MVLNSEWWLKWNPESVASGWLNFHMNSARILVLTQSTTQSTAWVPELINRKISDVLKFLRSVLISSAFSIFMCLLLLWFRCERALTHQANSSAAFTLGVLGSYIKNLFWSCRLWLAVSGAGYSALAWCVTALTRLQSDWTNPSKTVMFRVSLKTKMGRSISIRNPSSPLCLRSHNACISSTLTSSARRTSKWSRTLAG